MRAWLPIVIGPSTFAPVPICTKSPIVGPSTLKPTRLLFDNPIVTQGLIWQCRPIVTRPSITTLPCVIIRPSPASTWSPICTRKITRESVSQTPGSRGTCARRSKHFMRNNAIASQLSTNAISSHRLSRA